jgi:hypothetical protein
MALELFQNIQNSMANYQTPPEDDPPQEECEEGNSVLPDGVWCFGNWYVSTIRNSFVTSLFCDVATSFALEQNLANLCNIIGRTTFVNTLCGQDVLQHKEADDASEAHVEDGVKIKPVTVGAS